MTRDFTDGATIVACFQRRATRSIAAGGLPLATVVLSYGAIALYLAVRRPNTWNPDEPYNVVCGIAAAGIAVALLAVAPFQVAGAIGRARESGEMDAERLAGMPGGALAFGYILGNSLPCLLAAAVLVPALLVGIAGTPRAAVFSMIVGLAANGALSIAIAAAVGASVKRGATAGGAGLIAAAVPAVVGAFYVDTQTRALGLLGPWGVLIGSFQRVNDYRYDYYYANRYLFDLDVLGVEMPGVLLQVPFHLAMAAALFRVAVRRLDDEERSAFGLGTGTAITATTALVSWLLLLGGGLDARGGGGPWRASETLTAHAVFVLLASLPLAFAGAVSRAEVQRRLVAAGAKGREGYGPVASMWRAAGIASAIALIWGLGVAAGSGVRGPLLVPWLGAVIAGAATTAAVAAQANALLFIRAPRLIALVALAALWFGPWGVNAVASEIGFGLARDMSPFVEPTSPFATLGQVAWGAANGPSYAPIFGSGFRGALAVLFALLAAVGLTALVRTGLERVRLGVTELVAAPAEVFRPPMQTEQVRCPQGHLHEAKWASCPRCPAPVA